MTFCLVTSASSLKLSTNMVGNVKLPDTPSCFSLNVFMVSGVGLAHMFFAIVLLSPSVSWLLRRSLTVVGITAYSNRDNGASSLVIIRIPKSRDGSINR